jgi:uncharacterized protein (DUF427 family)
VSLTTGRGPLSPRPAGRFSAPVPSGVAYVEPFPRRVRGVAGGVAVVDSERVLLVHRPGQPPAYAFPAGDVAVPTAEPEPEAPGFVAVPWNAVDTWYEEAEEVSGHPRNPYHRIDCVRTARHLRVEVAGVTLVDTTTTLGVYETALAPRLYVARALVRTDLLVPSATTTYCPYKGTASYLTAVVDGTTVEDVAWCYDDPLPESLPLGGMLAFDPERATVTDDLPAAERPPPAGGA